MSSRKHADLQKFIVKSIEHKDEVILHMFPRYTFNIPSQSPFVIKLESFLRLYKIKYVCDYKYYFHPITNKTPWITFNGKHYYDSELIVEYLCKYFNVDINQKLNNKQIATAYSMSIMIQKSLQYVVLYKYFIDPQNGSAKQFMCYGSEKNETSNNFLIKIIPKTILHKIIAWRTYKHHLKYLQSFYGNGFIGNKIYEIGNQQINCILDYMENSKFFFGNTISYIDIVIFSWFSVLYNEDLKYGTKNIKLPKKEFVKKYCERINKLLFPEVESWRDYNYKQKGSFL